MKFFLLIFVSICASLAFEFTAPHNELFEQYARHYEVEFDSREDFLQRRENFLLKFRKILSHNRLYDWGEKSFKMGITKNSFYTREEAKKYLLGLKPEEGKFDGELEKGNEFNYGRRFLAPESKFERNFTNCWKV